MYFAVQLQWSVQAVQLDKVPPLAIFSAYTLYTVEGSREGRKWYGLRLGFFSDAISAKQVAYYVRSEFGSVAVVPVSPQEKARATDQEQAATLAAPRAARGDPSDEFKLIDDDSAARSVPMQAQPRPAAKAARLGPKAAVGRGVRQGTPQRGRVRGGGKVGARDPRGPAHAGGDPGDSRRERADDRRPTTARRSTTQACGTCASRCRRTRRSRNSSSASASG